REVGRLSGFVDVLEEGEELIEILLADRVELVVVTAAAFEGEAEEGSPHRGHAVYDVGDAELLFDHAALLVLHVQAIEGGGEALVLGRARQQVARELPGEKLVELLIAVE